MANEKYELIDEDRPDCLKRIRALRDTLHANKGDLGGLIQGEHNLNQYDNSWVYDSACVYGSAHVSDSALVYDSACVYGSAYVSGSACVYDSARVYDSACVYGSAYVSGSACVSGSARVYDSAYVSGSACVYDSAHVSGSACVSGSARVSGSVITANRSDGYTFMLAWCSDGELRVLAGCRYFTLPEAREHWQETRGGTRLGDETLTILDLLEKFPPEKP